MDLPTVGRRDYAERKSKGRKRSYENKEVASVNAVLNKHLKAVNELDPEKRKVFFEEVYDPHIHFVDPQGIANGLAELEKLYDGLHKQFPGFVFHEVGEIEAHHDVARIHWELVKPGASVKPTGDDFIKIKDGRITEVYVIVNGQPSR